MSEMGDFYREMRQERSALRRHWHECPHCAVRFGTGTSVAPGGRCRNCGWQAPGEHGDDRRAVKAAERAEREERRRKEAKNPFPCPYCDRRLKTPAGRGEHVQKLHAEEHDRRRVKMGKRTEFPETLTEGTTE